MAIDYDSDIVGDHYSSDVSNQTSYQSPGRFNLPSTFADVDAGKRVLCLVEVFQALLEAVESTQEAKLIHDVLGRMMSEMQFGSVAWDGNTMAASAKAAALKFIAGHVIPSRL